jgi:hypothetical protein
MAKKIELNKQTLRVLSSEEMEAVAGGINDTSAANADMPQTRSGCHTSTDVCAAVMAQPTTTGSTE